MSEDIQNCATKPNIFESLWIQNYTSDRDEIRYVYFSKSNLNAVEISCWSVMQNWFYANFHWTFHYQQLTAHWVLPRMHCIQQKFAWNQFCTTDQHEISTASKFDFEKYTYQISSLSDVWFWIHNDSNIFGLVAQFCISSEINFLP